VGQTPVSGLRLEGAGPLPSPASSEAAACSLVVAPATAAVGSAWCVLVHDPGGVAATAAVGSAWCVLVHDPGGVAATAAVGSAWCVLVHDPGWVAAWQSWQQTAGTAVVEEVEKSVGGRGQASVGSGRGKLHPLPHPSTAALSREAGLVQSWESVAGEEWWWGRGADVPVGGDWAWSCLPTENCRHDYRGVEHDSGQSTQHTEGWWAMFGTLVQ
jgi:hypothetical protein